MIEIGPKAVVSVYDYVGLKDHIASLFDGAVDVANREGLKPGLAPPRAPTPSMRARSVESALNDIRHHIALARSSLRNSITGLSRGRAHRLRQ